MTPDQYYEIRSRVVLCDSFLNELNKMCSAIPAYPFTRDVIWEVFWNKPIFANARIERAEKAIYLLKKIGFPSWSDMASPRWKIDYLNAGKGKSSSNQSFFAIGEDAKKCFGRVDEYEQWPGLGSSRIYAICQLASFIARSDSDPNGISLIPSSAPNSRLSADDLQKSTQLLSSAIGRGWGSTTVFHALTDLGIAIKPDIHLTRTLTWSGCISSLDRCVSEKEIDAFLAGEEARLLVVDTALSLAEKIIPLKQSMDHKRREVDLVLLWASKKEIVRRA